MSDYSDHQVECIVKLGGRAITHKERHETANTEAIQSAGALFCDTGIGKFIAVHGAGSFGHFEAKKYGVATGYRNSDGLTSPVKQVQMGLCKTRLSVTKLNHLLVSEFVQQGIPAVGMSPFNSYITNSKDSFKHADLDVLSQSLDEGYLPVLHGDAVLDQATGCSILGGDPLIEKLCCHFKPKRVVFLTDVNGVYDRPPDQQGANHIPQITVNQDGHIATILATSMSDHDVTGGIMGKIDCACRIVKHSKGRTKVFIGKLESTYSKDLVRNGMSKPEMMTEICYQ
ncbi:uncharacterized protein [Amphiura filiformis]|uniref:uncharacterized protein n=1 Tax=Amphiura filiformis TaxID=82378 RepID=UPI003B2173EB